MSHELVTVLDFRSLVYLGHRVAGDVLDNVEKAKAHLKALKALYPKKHLIAPWLTEVLIYDDADPAQRRQGLESCKYTIYRCDELFLVQDYGDDISSGMREEAEFAFKYYKPVSVLTSISATSYRLEEFKWLAHFNKAYPPAKKTTMLGEGFKP